MVGSDCFDISLVCVGQLVECFGCLCGLWVCGISRLRYSLCNNGR